MTMYYCASTGGFYLKAIHKDKIPLDAKEISCELYGSLLGREIEAGPDGLPRVKSPVPLSFDDRAAALLAEVDAHLNAAAKAKGYDSIVTAALRAALPMSPFHDEGIAFGTWMDQVYAKCYEVLALVMAGEMAEPGKEQLIALLPPLILPASKGA